MNNDYKSGLSRKERHVLQMGFESDEGLKDNNEFYVYQNKIRSKINGTLMDTLLLLKERDNVYNLNDELVKNHKILKEIVLLIGELMHDESELITQLIKSDKS